MEARVNFPFAVFPEPAAFFEPCEGSFDDPAFGNDGEGMEFAAFGNFDRSAQRFFYAIGKRLAHITAVGQHILHIGQSGFMEEECFQRTGSVGDIGGGHVNEVRESLRVYTDMALDARHQFATIIAFFFRSIGVLYALGINDDETGFLFPSIALSGLANQLFLKPPPASCLCPRAFGSNR